MRVVHRQALVPQTPAQMYALVNDVRRYPEFLPWCPATTVHSETPERVKATVGFERAGVRMSLTTCNTNVPEQSIDMALTEGPLKHFRGGWSFLPIRAPAVDGVAGEVRGCRVELTIEFEFSSAALTNAFVRRARAVHG
ncbi:MAG: type II toxin-antitoxin system RatA family toxin [Proteobacteria bacterium]|nr:type II toxin-antitoxin system RatA family toxin [Pseudomonadota bacterium]